MSDTNKEKTTKSSPTNKSSIDSKLTWLPKKTFELEITVPKVLIDQEYEKHLDHAAKETTIKGFRKGKAPKKLVEEKIGKTHILEEAVQHIVQKAYSESVSKHNLKPIISPKITPENIKNGEDWTLKATSCEAPEVKLGEYKQAIKGLKAKEAIWTPEKGEDPKQKKEVTLEEIFDELLKTAKIEIAELLIEEETNRLISGLIDQVNAAGLTIQQYLDSQKMTKEDMKKKYQQTAENTLKLEFALGAIGEEEKIIVEEKDLNEFIQKSDERTKKALQSPQQKAYLSLMLRKQKTVDFLKNL